MARGLSILALGASGYISIFSPEQKELPSLTEPFATEIIPTPTLEPTSTPRVENPAEVIGRIWEAYSKNDDLLSKTITIKFQEVTSFKDQSRLIAQNPWYFGELSPKVAEIVQRSEAERPYNFKDLKHIYGGFSFHASNEDGLVVFYTPPGVNHKGRFELFNKPHREPSSSRIGERGRFIPWK